MNAGDVASEPMRVVHVEQWIERVSGPPFDRSKIAAREWYERGYAVAPIPDDDQEHPLNRECPVCSTSGDE